VARIDKDARGVFRQDIVIIDDKYVGHLAVLLQFFLSKRVTAIFTIGREAITCGGYLECSRLSNQIVASRA
jgi:hypothetical protein